jgi:chemotaxis protein histidine kinase CheA
MDRIDPVLIEEFATEVVEHIAAAEQVLVRARSQDVPPEDINLLFRSFHSVKGLARVIGYTEPENLAHAAESLLAEVREGHCELDQDVQDLLLRALDTLTEAKNALVGGTEYAADAALLAELEAATAASKNDVPGGAPRAQRYMDANLLELYYDVDTLTALMELIEELLTAIAGALAEGKGTTDDQLAEDIETLSYAARKLEFATIERDFRLLGEEPSPVQFLRCLETITHLGKIAKRETAVKAAVNAAKDWLTTALPPLIETKRWDELELFQRILLPQGPFLGLLPQLTNPECPEAFGERAIAILLEALRKEFTPETGPILDTAGMSAVDIRNELVMRHCVSESLLKILHGRKIDLSRFRSVPTPLVARLESMQIDVGGDFYEVQYELPKETEGCFAVMADVQTMLAPVFAETIGMGGVHCLTVLAFSAAGDESFTALAVKAGHVLSLVKLDGHQNKTHYSIAVRRGEGSQAGGSQVRVPVALMDTMFGRIGQFFSVMTRFNGLIFDNEVPEVLRELSDFAVLRAPQLSPLVERLIRQHRDVAAIEAEAHRLLSQIHETTLGLRVIPLDGLFSRFPRMIRDTAQKSGKQVQFDARANGIRVDNGMLELLSDPLMHMLRNSVDHGIETPEERRDAGKPEVASISIGAEQRGNHILIDIRDDGRGINIERVLAKALANDLVDEEQAKTLTEEQIARFIFSPGFSTAETVTDTSGRGVGMDVALVNVTKLGGKIDILSRKGQGTCFSIEIPLSKAIQSMLLADTGVQKVAFPATAVNEVMICSRDAIQTVNGQRSVLLHDRFLPVFRLVDLLRLPQEETEPSADESIVVCEHEGQRLGVEVHKILRRTDLLIQEMHPRIAHMPGIGGISTIGTDKIVIVIDPSGLFDLARGHAVFGLRAHETRVTEGLF